MKRIITGIAASALVLSLCVTGALAAGRGCGGGHHGAAWSQAGAWTRHSAACGGYTDADGDGICDNCGAARGWRYVDADGDGVCDNCGTGAGRRSGCGGCRC